MRTAERGRERERKGVRELLQHAHTHTQHMKTKHAHAPQHAHAQKITKRSGEAERSGEVFFGGLSDYDTHSTLTRTRKPSAAVRPSAAK